MPPLWNLPDELLLEVTSYFLLYDLQSIAVTCRRLQSISHGQLQKHKELKRKYYKLDDLVQHQQTPAGWLDPFIALLKNEYPPCYTEVVNIHYPAWYWHELPVNQPHGIARGLMKPYSDEDMKLVVKAIETSPWIHVEDACGPGANAKNQAHFIEEVMQGDQDNILAVLLPLLPNLQRLQLPGGRSRDSLGSVPGVVRHIDRAYWNAQMANESTDHLPFSKLEFICTADKIDQGLLFDDLVPFLALPSIEEADFFGVQQDTFVWPRTPPLNVQGSNANRIYFAGSTTVEEAAVELANGMAGPCVLENNPPGMQDPLNLYLGPGRTDWARIVKDGEGEMQVIRREDLLLAPSNEPPRFYVRGLIDPNVPMSHHVQEQLIREVRRRGEKEARIAQRNTAALLPLGKPTLLMVRDQHLDNLVVAG